MSSTPTTPTTPAATAPARTSPPKLPLAHAPYPCANLLLLSDEILLDIIRKLDITSAARFALVSPKASSIVTPQLARLRELLRAEPKGVLGKPEWTGSRNSFRLHLALVTKVHSSQLGNLLVQVQKWGPKERFEEHKAEMMLFVRPSLRAGAGEEGEWQDEDEEWLREGEGEAEAEVEDEDGNQVIACGPSRE